MKIEADSRLAFPRSLVFTTYRDRLPELVPYLPNVKGIRVEKREDELEKGLSRLVNLWEAKAEIPKVLQPVLKPEMLAWLDYAIWNQNDWSVEWRIETRMLTESVRCGGKNRYVEDGSGMVLEMRGDLEIDLKGVPGVPRLLASAVAPTLEKFIVALLTPNLTSVAAGVEAFLKAESARG